jgi:hypothetical protein
MVIAACQDIEFKTLSGVTLRGWLCPAEKQGPGIILSAGVSSLLSSASVNTLCRGPSWKEKEPELTLDGKLTIYGNSSICPKTSSYPM